MTGSLGPNGWLGPNFFLVGAMKAGTTAVYANLDAHAEVYCSPIKEPNFFSDDLEIDKFTLSNAQAISQFDANAYVQSSMDEPVHAAYVRNPATYYALFRKADGKRAIGECSTSYLYSATAPRNIRLALPHARIIMILRNPVDRAISQYHMECRIGVARDPFGFLLEKDLAAPRTVWGQSGLYVELGRYVGQVERYLAHFPRKQVKIIVYDDLPRQLPRRHGRHSEVPWRRPGAPTSQHTQDQPRASAARAAIQPPTRPDRGQEPRQPHLPPASYRVG